MENLDFNKTQSGGFNPAEKYTNKDTKPFDPETELSGPSLRVLNATKMELGKLFGFGLKDIADDTDLMAEINRHFFSNRGMMENKTREWKVALGDVNKDATKVEEQMAKNFAQSVFDFITIESKLKDRYNN